jgi:hypothetical protein
MKSDRSRRVVVIALAAVLSLLSPTLIAAQDAAEAAQAEAREEEEGLGQSRESMANDSTAAQTSYQVAYEWRDWRTDQGPDGQPRPEGNQNMWQFRIVMPFQFEGFNLLPRLTLRNNEAVDGSSGAGNAEIFALFIPNATDWGTGRWGIGPQVNFPADSEQFGTTEWRYGIATAALQRAAADKMLYGVLVQQLWGETDPTRPGSTVASPITIQPVFNYALPKSFYLNIGETAFSYNWKAEAWLIPIGVRFGKLWVKESGTKNLYFEYRTSIVYDDWPGSVIKDAYRINFSYTIPQKKKKKS